MRNRDMTDTTLRAAITNSLNELSNLKFQTTDPEQLNEIRDNCLTLLHQLDKVLDNILDNQTPDFIQALKSLNELTAMAKEAADDVNKIAATIQKAADAIGKVGKVVTNLAGFL
jgi:methyl-accepting chemotaxis protein